MNKSTKGAFAAGTAAVLLLGGAGSLAYWNDTASVPGGSINSGNLALNSSSCTTAGWKVTNPAGSVTPVAFDPATQKIVPGDTLTKTCTVVVDAVGTNLKASLAATGGANNASTMAAGAYTVGGSFKIGTTAISTITSADANKTIDAVITVAFPFGTAVDNDSKLKTIAFNAFTITATQLAS